MNFLKCYINNTSPPPNQRCFKEIRNITYLSTPQKGYLQLFNVSYFNFMFYVEKREMKKRFILTFIIGVYLLSDVVDRI